MKIELAKTAGFCFGVDRAVKMLYELIEKGEKVCTLGPIIHNPQVIEDLTNKGVKIIENPEQADKEHIVVIRAHGVTKQTTEKLEQLGVSYIDATCPYVMKIHRIIEKHSNENNVVMIAGDENHPEVCGFRSRCKGESFVFKNYEELFQFFEKCPDYANKELLFVAQTTFSLEEWKKCLNFFKKVCTNSIYFDTICRATRDRQNEALEMSKRCDEMIVIGGHFSSNTVKLKSVCEKNCPTYLIERAQELEKINFASCKLIGVTAGASTPAGIIKEVLFTMSENLNEKNSSENFNFAEALEENLETSMSTEPQVVGEVVGIAPNEIQVDIGRKYAGFIPAEEYSYDPTADHTQELKIGDKLNLIIMKTNDVEGTIMLSKRRYDRIAAWEKIVAAKENEEILEASVAEAVKGGVLVYPFGVRVFIPASLTGLPRNADVSELVKQNVKFKVIDTQDKPRRRVIGSIKVVSDAERKAKADAFWAQAEVGQEYTGKVTALTSYGAFVDLGGVEGMIHISQLAWTKIKHPSEVVNVGDIVKVTILELLTEDEKKKKISLGYKKAEDNPWEIFKANHKVGDVVEVKITGFASYGAFAVMTEDGTKGLIHISQIADRRIDTPQSVLSVDQVVQAQISEIDLERNRVNFSIRALIEEEKKKADEEASEYLAKENEQEETAEEAQAEETPVEEAPEQEAETAEAPAEETAE
ncbi:MAG: bifunctional 4-hydroxy-3-methylbut-2-enyl diphosphate reductase/30S ribosomal protein S1 [Acutalibacteraceae bacterium]